jgi:hypothetical protein
MIARGIEAGWPRRLAAQCTEPGPQPADAPNAEGWHAISERNSGSWKRDFLPGLCQSVVI